MIIDEHLSLSSRFRRNRVGTQGSDPEDRALATAGLGSRRV